MEDLIACLYPYNDGKYDGNKRSHAWKAVKINPSRFVPAQRQRPTLRGRGSRESTAPLEDNNNKEKNEEPASYLYEPGIQLTFSYGPKGGPGFVFGTYGPGCDVVLPNIEDNKISRRHCYLNFDAHNRLILRDTSTHGTIVTYDGKGGFKRRNFTWILGGYEFADDANTIVIEFHEALKFQIVVKKRRGFPHIYIDNINQFPKAEEAAIDELPTGRLGRFGIQSERSTAVQSRAHSPGSIPIYIDIELLGEGSFAVVKRVWNVSTGFEYASKKSKRKRFKWELWNKEIKIMKEISHVSYIIHPLNAVLANALIDAYRSA